MWFNWDKLQLTPKKVPQSNEQKIRVLLSQKTSQSNLEKTSRYIQGFVSCKPTIKVG